MLFPFLMHQQKKKLNELQAVMKNTATLIITNRAPTMSFDGVVFIENGSVKAQGTHTELIDNIQVINLCF